MVFGKTCVASLEDQQKRFFKNQKGVLQLKKVSDGVERFEKQLTKNNTF